MLAKMLIWNRPFVAFIRQGVGYKRGDLIHELIRVPTVQQARKAPHVTLPCCFALFFHLHSQVQHSWLALHTMTHTRFRFFTFAKVILTPTHTCTPACCEQHRNSATLHTCNLHSCIFLHTMLKPARQYELKSSLCPSYDDAFTRCFCLYNHLTVYISASLGRHA